MFVAFIIALLTEHRQDRAKPSANKTTKYFPLLWKVFYSLQRNTNEYKK